MLCFKWYFEISVWLSSRVLTCAVVFSFPIPFSDINECDEDPHVCHRIANNSDCENRRPGFECLCKSGFQPVYNNSVLVNCTGKTLFFLWKVELRRGLEEAGQEGKRRRWKFIKEK